MDIGDSAMSFEISSKNRVENRWTDLVHCHHDRDALETYLGSIGRSNRIRYFQIYSTGYVPFVRYTQPFRDVSTLLIAVYKS